MAEVHYGTLVVVSFRVQIHGQSRRFAPDEVKVQEKPFEAYTDLQEIAEVQQHV